MRIGLEMFGTQTAGRTRGVGRYCRNLGAALLARAHTRGHHLVFYAVDGLPTDLIPQGPNATLRAVKPEPHLRYTMTRLATANPDDLDVLLLGNPLELNPGNDLPARPASRHAPALAAIAYDLIPLIFADAYLRRWPGHEYARRYLWGLERLRAYDRLLAISHATRDDLTRLLRIDPAKVVAIGTGGDDPAADFSPAHDPADLDHLRALGVAGPYVFSVAAADPRKNLSGLIEAFARVPSTIAPQLVVAAGSGEGVQGARERIEALGLADRVTLLARPVDDPTLRALYRRCDAFVFPSLYEGFGLPILEALRCGAPVVAGDNSSQPEVAGDAALLANASDPAALAHAIHRVLAEPGLADALRARSQARAAPFTWDRVADRTLDALEALSRSRTKPRPKPRLALFSPLPPHRSGIATYVASLLGALGTHFAIDLYHDEKAYPAARFDGRSFAAFDHRLFPRADRVRPYDAALYEMGNSPAHAFVLDHLLRKPGVVDLHDLALGSFHYERATHLGGGLPAFRAELEASHPGRRAEFDRHLAGWQAHPEAMVAALTASGLDMNGGIVDAAGALIVHSRGALERLGPRASSRGFVIPLGTSAEPPDPHDRRAARARLGLPDDALVVGTFGIVHRSKLNAEAIQAFAALASSDPDAIMLIVGEESDGGEARTKAASLGLEHRVRFLGRPDDPGFRAAIAATDLGLALRRPPTNGESSAALLDLLRAGVPTLVTDTGSFRELPDAAVRKVPWPDDARGPESLRAALLALAADPPARQSLARAARDHVSAHLGWPTIATAYAEVINRWIEQTRRVGAAR